METKNEEMAIKPKGKCSKVECIFDVVGRKIM
jgi:hypothetical protein